MPPGLNAGLIHLDELVEKLNIDTGDLALMKAEALIKIMTDNKDLENMTTSLENRVNKIVFDRLKETWEKTLEMINGHEEQ